MKPIIDISFYQSPPAVDYDLLSTQIDGVILRGAYGIWKDTAFDQHYAEFTSRGIKIGAYHYIIGSQNVLAQSQAFAAAVVGKSLELGTWIDVEDRREGTRIYRNQVIEYAGYQPNAGIYTSKSAWAEIMGGVYLNDRPLWVAHYTTNPQPLLPQGWDRYVLWQYTSSGRMAGYAGNLDCNRVGEQAEKLFDAKVITTYPNRLRTRYSPAGEVRPQADWYQSGQVVSVYEQVPDWYRTAVETWASADWLRRTDIEPPAPITGEYYGPAYNQRDNRWKDVKLGTSATTIGANGCLITAVSMLCNYHGHASNPYSLNKWLTENGGYFDQNLFLWDKLSDLYPDMQFDGFLYYPSERVLADMVRAGQLPVIYVDFNDATPQIEMHWVLGIGTEGDHVIIADPWTGNIGRLTDIYSKPVIRVGSYRRAL